MGKLDHLPDPLGHVPLLVRRHRQVHIFRKLRPRIIGDQLQMIDAQVLQLGDTLPCHFQGHVHEQSPGALGNLPQLLDGGPAVGNLDSHDLAVRGNVLLHLLRGVKGVRGHHKQVRLLQMPHGGTVPHAVHADRHIFPKQRLNLIRVKAARPGVQRHHGNRLFHILYSSQVLSAGRPGNAPHSQTAHTAGPQPSPSAHAPSPHPKNADPPRSPP